jgi:ECF transporter S component (folate family)
MFGPVVGGSVGAISDLLSYLLTGQSYPLNIVVTLGAVSIGIVSGWVAKFIVKSHGTKQFILAGGSAHFIGSMIIKPIGLFQFYGWAVLFRIPLYLAIAPIEILLISLLYKKSGFRRLIDEVEKK